jgi:hypothetical protein|tara:strand:- start:1211 stop:1489 length:279 start_codon:yes stop_codon:yes gene_type:complete
MSQFREFRKLLQVARVHNGGSAKKVNEIKKQALTSAFEKLDKVEQARIMEESEYLQKQIVWLGEAGALELIATIGLHGVSTPESIKAIDERK